MLLSIIAGLFLKPVLAAVYTDPSKLPVISYTHIIVGGTSGVYGYLALSDTCLAGVGGSVLANRLSENPKNCVLLVEAGPRFVVFFFCPRSPVAGGLYTPAIQLILLFPFRSLPRHSHLLLSHGTIPRSLRLVWEGGRSRILADALLVDRLRLVSWVNSESTTTDLVFSRLYGLDSRTSVRLQSTG